MSGCCEAGNPSQSKSERVKKAMRSIKTIPEFVDIKWMILKEKTSKEHEEDFKKRGINSVIKQDNTFDSTNYGHTEQAFVQSLRFR